MTITVYFIVLLAAASATSNSQHHETRMYFGLNAIINDTWTYLPFVTDDGSSLCAMDTPWTNVYGNLAQCSQSCSNLEGCFYFNHRSHESHDTCEMFDCMPLIFDVVDGCQGYQRDDTVLSCQPDANGAIPSRCCSYPFTWNGETHLQCTPLSADDQTPGCLNKNGQWASCQQPSNYMATWESARYGGLFGLPVFSINNWIMIANRVEADSSSVEFDQSWSNYRNGFGILSLNDNYWIGNEHLHELTSHQREVKLRIEIKRADNRWYYAEYQSFVVGNEASNYQLAVDANSYHGDAGQALGSANDMKFSTRDHDNDNCNCQCAVSHGAGWWYNDCGTTAPLQSPSGLWTTENNGVADVVASRLFIKQIKSTVN